MYWAATNDGTVATTKTAINFETFSLANNIFPIFFRYITKMATDPFADWLRTRLGGVRVKFECTTVSRPTLSGRSTRHAEVSGSRCRHYTVRTHTHHLTARVYPVSNAAQKRPIVSCPLLHGMKYNYVYEPSCWVRVYFAYAQVSLKTRV